MFAFLASCFILAISIKFSNAVEPYVTLRIKENENIIEKAKEFLNTVIEI